MQALRTLAGLAFGLWMPLAALPGVETATGGLAGAAMAVVEHKIDPQAWLRPQHRQAEVSVVFDGRGHVASSALRRSSGSAASDRAAVGAALELASLHRPSEVAGRTLVVRASFGGGVTSVD